jgi:hypothetical protein
MVESKVEVVEKKSIDEATTKVFEEDKRKRNEDTLNNDASPIDTYVLGWSKKYPFTSGHLLVDECGLGLYVPSNPNKVAKLKNCRFDKVTEMIVQRQTRKVPFTSPLLVVTNTPMEK